MFDVVFYIVSVYLFVLPLAWLAARLPVPRRRLAKACVVCVVLTMPLLPYAVVELRTIVYGQTLRKPVIHTLEEEPMLCGAHGIRLLKVLRMTPRRAVVYVVVPEENSSPPAYSGFTLQFARIGDQWKFDGEWDLIWTDSGNADDNVFPPYPGEGDFSK